MKLSLKYYFFGFSLILLLSLLCYGQEKVRKIEKRPTKNEPIELVSAEVGNKIFNNENQILADKDWLKNLKLNVKNISDKKIVYIKVELDVERQGKMQYPLGLPLVFGQKPPPELTDTDVAKLEGLKPNESVKISITPSILDHFTTKFMPENEIKDIEQVKFFFDFIVFDDGTAWSRGRLMRRNPNNENQWQTIREQKEVSFLQNMLNIPLKFINSWQENKVASCRSTNSGFFLQII